MEATGVVEEVGEQGAGPVEVVGRDAIPAGQRSPQSFHGPRPLDARCLHGRRSLLRLPGRGRPLRLGLLLLHRRHGPRRDVERCRKRCGRVVIIVGSGPAELLEQGPRLAGEIFVVAGDVGGELLGIPEHARLLPLLIGREDLRLLREQLRRAVFHPQPFGIEPVGWHVQKRQPLEPIVELVVELQLQPALERRVDRLGPERRHEARFAVERPDAREGEQGGVEKLAPFLRHRLGLGEDEVVAPLVVAGIEPGSPLGILLEQLPIALGRPPHDGLPLGRSGRQRLRLLEVGIPDQEPGLEEFTAQFVLPVLEFLHQFHVGRRLLGRPPGLLSARRFIPLLLLAGVLELGESGIDITEAREDGILGVRRRRNFRRRIAGRCLEGGNRGIEKRNGFRHDLRAVLAGALGLQELDPPTLDEEVPLLRVCGDRLVAGRPCRQAPIDLLCRLFEHRGPPRPGRLATRKPSQRVGASQRKTLPQFGRGPRVVGHPIEHGQNDVVHSLFGEGVEEAARGDFGVAGARRSAFFTLQNRSEKHLPAANHQHRQRCQKATQQENRPDPVTGAAVTVETHHDPAPGIFAPRPSRASRCAHRMQPSRQEGATGQTIHTASAAPPAPPAQCLPCIVPIAAEASNTSSPRRITSGRHGSRRTTSPASWAVGPPGASAPP